MTNYVIKTINNQLFEKKKKQSLLGEMIAHSFLPFKKVNNVGFIKLLNILDC
jgi:hypothetical protein